MLGILIEVNPLFLLGLGFLCLIIFIFLSQFHPPLCPVKVIDPEWKEKGIKNVKKAKDFLKNYRWSSYQDYLGINRVQRKILTTKDFPVYFTDVKTFEREIFEWLQFTPKSDIGEDKG